MAIRVDWYYASSVIYQRPYKDVMTSLRTREDVCDLIDDVLESLGY